MKNSGDGGDIYEYKDPFWDSCQSGKCDYSRVKASFWKQVPGYRVLCREKWYCSFRFENTNKMPVRFGLSQSI